VQSEGVFIPSSTPEAHLASQPPTKVAIACTGGGTHAAFEIGVLTAILEEMEVRKRDENARQFDLIGLSGTSAGALCALMVWYGLANKKGPDGSAREGSARAAIRQLNCLMDVFAAKTGSEKAFNWLGSLALKTHELEAPLLGLVPPKLGLSPAGAISRAVFAAAPYLGVRAEYADFHDMLDKLCPEFCAIDWQTLKVRLLVGASEVVGGVETVFDSDLNILARMAEQPEIFLTHRWHKRLPLTLSSVVASGSLPELFPAEEIDERYYWDGLYSQNPPVREFVAVAVPHYEQYAPDEIWVVRINPQQCEYVPTSMAAIEDRQNELMGNLSLNKELDLILNLNRYRDSQTKRPVTVRTIKMTKRTAMRLKYSSKFDRSRAFVEELRDEGYAEAEKWLSQWGDEKVGEYPDDAGYPDDP
jgi:NTE family protein